MLPVLVFDYDGTLVKLSGMPFEHTVELLHELKDRYKMWIVSYNDRVHLGPRSVLECFNTVLGGFHSGGKVEMMKFLCNQKGVDIKNCIFFDDDVANITETSESGVCSKLVNPKRGVTRVDIDNAIDMWRESHQPTEPKLIVAVGSANFTKINAVLAVFTGWNFEFRNVDSGVLSQPVGMEVTATGAINRLNEIERLVPDADAWVGVENGLICIDDNTGWVDVPVVALRMKGMWRKIAVGAGVPVTFHGPNEMLHYEEKMQEIENKSCEHFTDSYVSRGELIKQAVKIARYSIV